MENLINFGESRIVLSKNSTEEQIRAYFEYVLKLYESNEKYPVDLEDVWPVVYSSKDKAVRALKQKFFENEDFIRFTQNGERVKNGTFNGSKPDVYKLTTSCMEYFIARKVRSVFNVYREVFNQVATGKVQVAPKAMTAVQMFALQAQINLENENRLNALEKKVEDIEAEREENGRLLLEAQVSTNVVPTMTLRKNIIALVNEYSSATNTPQKDVWHSVYKDLYYKYDKSINSYTKLFSKESKLDVAERKGLLQPIFDIISDMIVRWRDSKK
jgi:hypothetical protein